MHANKKIFFVAALMWIFCVFDAAAFIISTQPINCERKCAAAAAVVVVVVLVVGEVAVVARLVGWLESLART